MPSRTRPVNILVVDDENFFAEWLAENLRDTSTWYDAHWVNSGERALEFMERQPVDLVISDIKMAGVSGIELLNQIRARYPGAGVILMTGYALPELHQEATRRGSLFYLEKPFPMEKLESAIEEALTTLPLVAPPAEAEAPMAQLTLLDTLHLFHLSRSNKTLRVKAPDAEGVIYYQDGEVIHAFSQGVEGEAAFAHIVSGESSDYEVRADEPAPSRSIFRDFDSLIAPAVEPAPAEPMALESSLIETAAEPLVEVELAEPPTPLTDGAPVADARHLDLVEPPAATDALPALSDEEQRALWELLAASDHMEGGALITTDGRVLISTLLEAWLTPAAAVQAGALFQTSCRLSGELGRGNHRQSLIQGELGNVIISDVGEGVFLLFVTNAKATLGLTLLQARQRAQKVAHVVAKAL